MLRGRLKIPTKIKHLYANSVDSILINEAQSTDLVILRTCSDVIHSGKSLTQFVVWIRKVGVRKTLNFHSKLNMK